MPFNSAFPDPVDELAFSEILRYSKIDPISEFVAYWSAEEVNWASCPEASHFCGYEWALGELRILPETKKFSRKWDNRGEPVLLNHRVTGINPRFNPLAAGESFFNLVEAGDRL